jgi:hypothetical protein
VAIFVIERNVALTEVKVVVVVPNVVVQICVRTLNVVHLGVLAVAVNVRARPRAQPEQINQRQNRQANHRQKNVPVLVAVVDSTKYGKPVVVVPAIVLVQLNLHVSVTIHESDQYVEQFGDSPWDKIFLFSEQLI